MKYIKLFEQFARKEFYHFSENANLKLGESLNSSLCKDPFYLETVMPIYRHLAEKKGIEWPVNHGYAFSGENGPVFWVYGSKKNHNSEDIRAELKTKLNCYRVKAESETISGPMDFSPGACTMLFKNAGSAKVHNYTIEEFAKNYFRTDFNLDMAEWICNKFIIEEKLESSDWKVMYADDERLDTGNMKHLKTFESVDKAFVKDFFTDFGTLISLNFSQISKMGKDSDATRELTLMMQQLRKPIINGQTYFDFIKDNINTVPNNPKLLSTLLGIVRDFLIYIEPRVKKFVTDEPASNGVNYKESWLKRIEKIKNDYKLIVSQ